MLLAPVDLPVNPEISLRFASESQRDLAAISTKARAKTLLAYRVPKPRRRQVRTAPSPTSAIPGRSGQANFAAIA
jgi:hypothetical protein